ncbi:MFS transporter [Arthrobacter pigmenti]
MTPQRLRLGLSVQAILTQVAWVGVRLMIGYRALAEGADAPFLGAVAASFALPGLLAALPTGRLCDRWGGARVSLLGIGFAVGGTVGLILSSGLWILLPIGAVIALGNLLVVVGHQTFVATHHGVGESRDGAFGTLTAAVSIGQMIGPPLVAGAAALLMEDPADSAGSAPTPDTTAGLLATVVCALLGAPLYLVVRSADREKAPHPSANRSKQRTGTVLRAPGMWRSLVVSGAVLVTVDLIYAFIPVWAVEQNVGIAVVGWLLALRSAVSVISRFGLASLVRRFGRKMLLIISIAVGTFSLAALPVLDAYGAIWAMIGLGVGTGLPQPMTMAWVVGLNPVSHGAALGVRMTANKLAQTTIPLAVGAAAAPLGVAGVFWANAVLLAASAFIVAHSDPGR